MKKVAIYGQTYSVSATDEIKILMGVLNKYKIVAFFEENFYQLLKEEQVLVKKYPTFASYNDLSSSFDSMITLGGDGTILRAVTYIRDLEIPILGINTGRLGFLATVQKNKIKEAIKLVVKNKFSVQKRSLLQIKTTPTYKEVEELNFALNEVTIARRNTTSMIGVKTYLNQEYLTNYWSDGLIVATPTGSTGYSLSCQGPVILPNSESLIITPIAPHNLNARPMVIPDDIEITLEVSAREKEFLISLDSRIATVSNNTIVKIKKADFYANTIVLENQSYLKTLRKKLLWGEDTRNDSNS